MSGNRDLTAEERLEEQRETALEEGQEVYNLNWCSDWGGGYVSIYKHKRRYWVTSDDDHPTEPFTSLFEALDSSSALLITPAVTDVTCGRYSAKRLLQMFTVEANGDERVAVTINGEEWECREKKWAKVTSEDL